MVIISIKGKKMKKLLFSAVACSFLLVGAANAKDYAVDPTHTNVGFKIKHLQISNVRGSFDDFEGKIDFDPETKELKKFEAIVKVASINTKNEGRDDHLRNPDYFEVEKYPEMKFVMKEFVKEDDGEEGVVKGDLTIKDVTLPVEFEYDFGGVIKNEKVDKIGFTLEGEIDRTKFNVGEESIGIGSEVDITIEVEADAI